MPVYKAISYDDEEREGFRFGGGSRRGGGPKGRRGKRGSGPSRRGRGGPSRGKRGSGPSKRGRGGPSKRSSSGPTKRGRLGPTKTSSTGPTKRGRLGPTKTSSTGPTKKGRLGPTKAPSQRQPGLTKTNAQKAAEKAYNKKTAWQGGGSFVKDSKGNLVRSKTQVAKEGAKRAQERVLRKLIAPSIQAGEAKQVTPTDSSIRTVAEAKQSAMSDALKNQKTLGQTRTPEQLNKLAILNKAMGLNPAAGMGIADSLKYNFTNPEFKADLQQVKDLYSALPLPTNILKNAIFGTKQLTQPIRALWNKNLKQDIATGKFESGQKKPGLLGGIGNFFGGLKIGPSDAGTERGGGRRGDREGIYGGLDPLSSSAVARDAAPVLSTPVADPVNPTTGAIDYSNAMASSPVLTTPAASPTATTPIATQGTPYRLRDHYARVLGQDPTMYAADGGRIGFQDGGWTPLSEDQLSGGWSQQAADLTGLFDRRYGGYSGDLSYAYGRGFDPQATKSALAKKFGTTDPREMRQDMQRYNQTLNEIKADQLRNVREMEESYGLSVSDKERDLIRNALSGQLGQLSGSNVAGSAEGLDQERQANAVAMRNLSDYLATSDLGSRFSQALGPEEMIEATAPQPTVEPGGVVKELTPAVAPTEAAPIMTTPVAAETAPVSGSPSPMTYDQSYAAPSVALPAPTVSSPTTNMSQYYSSVLDTPSFDSNSPSVASQIASQYLSPQEAQVYAANGGRIGFEEGGMAYYIQNKPVDKETYDLKGRQENLNITGQKAFKSMTEKYPDMSTWEIMDIIENKFPQYVTNPNDPQSALKANGGRVGRMGGGMMIMGDNGVVNNGIGGILSKYKEIRSEL